MKISEMIKESRPRERFINHGPESLSEAELLSIILRTGNKQENVVDVSNRLMKEFGLEGLFECSLKELEKIKGIGPTKAMQLLTIRELGKRYNSNKKKPNKITSSKDVFNLFSDKLKNKKQENFFTLILDTKNQPLKIEKISLGILDASIIHPREIFKPAIKNSASSIILVHNHPSGDPTPSQEDLDITNKLKDIGEMLGIEVLDHVIIGNETWWSFEEDL